MIKCRIHIYNPADFMDKKVYVECLLPAIPEIGSVLYITERHLIELESNARLNKDVADTYFPDWFHGKSCSCKDINKADLNDLSFDGAIYVTDVLFVADRDYVDIEIDDIEKNQRK